MDWKAFLKNTAAVVMAATGLALAAVAAWGYLSSLRYTLLTFGG